MNDYSYDTFFKEFEKSEARNKCFFVFFSDKLVAQEHFGGFLSQANYEQIGGQHKSWKEKMEELITKSKKEKVKVWMI